MVTASGPATAERPTASGAAIRAVDVSLTFRGDRTVHALDRLSLGGHDFAS